MLQIAQFLSWASLNDVDILWVIWRLSAFRAYAYLNQYCLPINFVI